MGLYLITWDSVSFCSAKNTRARTHTHTHTHTHSQPRPQPLEVVLAFHYYRLGANLGDCVYTMCNYLCMLCVCCSRVLRFTKSLVMSSGWSCLCSHKSCIHSIFQWSPDRSIVWTELAFLSSKHCLHRILLLLRQWLCMEADFMRLGLAFEEPNSKLDHRA